MGSDVLRPKHCTVIVHAKSFTRGRCDWASWLSNERSDPIAPKQAANQPAAWSFHSNGPHVPSTPHLPPHRTHRAAKHGWNRRGLAAGLVLLAASLGGAARSQDLPEYRLKAAFVYNFLVYTEWPAAVAPAGVPLQVCIAGADPFGNDIDALHGRMVGGRPIELQRKSAAAPLKACHAVFISNASEDRWVRVFSGLKGKPVLVITDSPGALAHGATLNMNLLRDRVTFEANLANAREAGLQLSSKLLRLATEVQQ
jgi:YfiR/HmsC-like